MSKSEWSDATRYHSDLIRALQRVCHEEVKFMAFCRNYFTPERLLALLPSMIWSLQHFKTKPGEDYFIARALLWREVTGLAQYSLQSLGESFRRAWSRSDSDAPAETIALPFGYSVSGKMFYIERPSSGGVIEYLYHVLPKQKPGQWTSIPIGDPAKKRAVDYVDFTRLVLTETLDYLKNLVVVDWQAGSKPRLDIPGFTDPTNCPRITLLLPGGGEIGQALSDLNRVKKVPWIIGFVGAEGERQYYLFCPFKSLMAKDWQTHLPGLEDALRALVPSKAGT